MPLKQYHIFIFCIQEFSFIEMDYWRWFLLSLYKSVVELSGSAKHILEWIGLGDCL